MSDANAHAPAGEHAGHAVAEQGMVLLEGPDGIAVSLSPAAAQATGESLIAAAQAARLPEVSMKLTPFKVTIRVFDPGQGLDRGEDYVLPVDSPDAEHAAASTLANAASFTPKIVDGRPRSVAFCCMAVEARR